MHAVFVVAAVGVDPRAGVTMAVWVPGCVGVDMMPISPSGRGGSLWVDAMEMVWQGLGLWWLPSHSLLQ